METLILLFLIVSMVRGELLDEEGRRAQICEAFSNTTQDGEFTSPNYPSDYPHGINCTKVIRAPPHHVIRLSFIESFKIEQGPECSHDYLEIRDGRFGYSNLINENRICGNIAPTFIKSSGEWLWLRFRSDEDVSYVGFRIRIHFEPVVESPEWPPCTPLQTPNATWGLISTIDLPLSPLSAFIDCTWLITAPQGFKIYLQFAKYELERPNDCSHNFVQVYGSKTELKPEWDGLLAQFCGSDKESVQSRGEIMHLRYFTITTPGKKPSFVEAYWSFFREVAEDPCDPLTEFDCSDSTCIDKDFVCNQWANCKNRNDEDKGRCGKKDTFELTTDILIIAFLGILLMSGMCSGLLLNIYRKLRPEKPMSISNLNLSQQQIIPTIIPNPETKTKSVVMEMRDSACQTRAADLLVFH